MVEDCKSENRGLQNVSDTLPVAEQKFLIDSMRPVVREQFLRRRSFYVAVCVLGMKNGNSKY